MEQGDSQDVALDTVPFVNPDAWSKKRKKHHKQMGQTILST